MSESTLSNVASQTLPNDTRWYCEWEFYAVCLLVLGIYFTRMTLLPACGEETRVAHMAVQMIETGDWIVPRQQGVAFPERPPMGAWCMALVGLTRGEVDLVAMRLPSVLALFATAVLIYIYAKTYLTRLGACASAIAYISAAQVLQIGRQGESEALFTLFVGASLLVWHWGYLHRWHPAWNWIAGYALTALGALTKGPQAPIYFCAATFTYLIVKRDWRRLFGWPHLLGIATCVGIVSLWLVPFAQQMGLEATNDIWTILARKRFGTGGIFKHIISYPLETLACLLPWSPLALHLLGKRFRTSLADIQLPLGFLVTAIVVTYPSVLLANGARGRYYMPLYPVLAVLLGIAIERSVFAAAGTFARAGWNRFLVSIATLATLSGIGLFAITWLKPEKLASITQPLLWSAAYLLLSLGAAAILWWAKYENRRASVALCTTALLLGMVYTGLILNLRARSANDIAPAVAAVRQLLPANAALVSLGPIAHQFAFAYQQPIRELPWPTARQPLETNVDYFCYHTTGLDKPGFIRLGRGMNCEYVPAELPFAWEEVTRLNYGRERDDTHSQVIIGRVLSRTAQISRHDDLLSQHVARP
jgi:4-amino-4-deoxy-L-arabinose transferase-like glycosyltransferase